MKAHNMYTRSVVHLPNKTAVILPTDFFGCESLDTTKVINVVNK